MNFYLVDTNVIIWFLEGSRSLSDRVRNILLCRNSHIIIPIDIFDDLRNEYAKIFKSKNVDVPSPQIVMHIARKVKNVFILPFDELAMVELIKIERSKELNKDPVDRKIVSAFLSLVGILCDKGHKLYIITSDTDIKQFISQKGYDDNIYFVKR
jgi:PIN domain nuclease of toxin-antitoxin system